MFGEEEDVNKISGGDKTWIEWYVDFIQRMRRDSLEENPEATLFHKCIAEAFGTGVIVLTGVGSINAAVFAGALVGLWQIAVVWGFGITLAILTTAPVSGAHLNPAVTLAFCLIRPDEFNPWLMLPYWCAQLFGAFIAGFINYAVYHSIIDQFEENLGIIRGEDDSVQSAIGFADFFPNPAFRFSNGSQSGLQWDEDTVTATGSFGLEVLGTAFLMIVILSVTDKRNTSIPNKEMAPFWIGFTAAVLISLYAPLDMQGLNPARDFGPRLVAAVLGWGKVALPGPNGGFWSYIIGPLIGAPLGGAFYDFVLRPPGNSFKE